MLGDANTTMGYNYLKSYTSYSDCGYGYNCLGILTSVAVCTEFGLDCLSTNTTSDVLTGFGFSVLQNASGNHCASFGFNSGSNITTGVPNTSFRILSGCNNSSYGDEIENTCLGYNTLRKGGYYNTSLGYNSNGNSPVGTEFSRAISYNVTPSGNQVILETAAEIVICPNFLLVNEFVQLKISDFPHCLLWRE